MPRIPYLILGILVVACDSSGLTRSRGIANVHPDFPPRITQVGDRSLEWVIHLSTGACCSVENELQRDVTGSLVTIVPYFTYVPCADRCLAILRDSAVYEFAPGEVRIRVMGEDEQGGLIEAWDTTVVVN